MKIDIHTHILPENWPNLKEEFGYGGWVSLEHHDPGSAKMLKDNEFFRTVEANCWDPNIRMKECDYHGVDVQVLSTVPIMFSYWSEPNDALVLSKILNDHISKIIFRIIGIICGFNKFPRFQFTQRKWVIGSQCNLVLSHFFDEKI